MNKNELIVAIAEKADLRRVDVERVLSLFIETMLETLQNGEKLSYAGFGNFEVKHKAERTAINPATKEKILVPAAKVPNFKFSKNIKEIINQ